MRKELESRFDKDDYSGWSWKVLKNMTSKD
jgi:hypothetical protein